MLHRRFPKTFTPGLISALSAALAPPNRAALAALAPEQREKEDAARVTRQRPVLRVCAELALVGIIRDAPGRSGGEWMIKVIKDLVSSTTLESVCKLSPVLVVQRSHSLVSAAIVHLSEVFRTTLPRDNATCELQTNLSVL